MDNFLVFIKISRPEYLEKYAIIPNMYSEFVQLTKDLSTSKGVPENMIECPISLKVDWKKNHINENIINYTTGAVHNIEVAMSRVIGCITNYLNNALILMHYIPKDGEEKFNERCVIYELCTVVFEDKMSKKKMVLNFRRNYISRQII